MTGNKLSFLNLKNKVSALQKLKIQGILENALKSGLNLDEIAEYPGMSAEAKNSMLFL